MSWRSGPCTDVREKPGPCRHLRQGLVGCWLAMNLASGVAWAQDGEAAAGHQHHGSALKGENYTRAVTHYSPPSVVLLDSRGTEVNLATVLEYEGPLLLQFIFTTCPAVCPVLSASFQATQDQLGDDLEKVRMVSVSIDPEHDTPRRLSEYARRFEAGRQWLFLTGHRDDVVAVQKSFDAFSGNKMRHEPLTFLRPVAGDLWLRFQGFLSAADLAAEVRAHLDADSASTP